jgi:hypothetical protein
MVAASRRWRASSKWSWSEPGPGLFSAAISPARARKLRPEATAARRVRLDRERGADEGGGGAAQAGDARHEGVAVGEAMVCRPSVT